MLDNMALKYHAYGFHCPECGHPETIVEDRILNDRHEDVGMTLYCISCEHVWDEIWA